MPWNLHFISKGRETISADKQTLETALIAACDFRRQSLDGEIQKITGPNGEEIGAEEITRWCSDNRNKWDR